MSDDRHDRVSRRAYELWEEQGGEHGRHEDHWHRASAEIDDPGTDEEASDAQATLTAPDGTTLTVPTETDAKPARKRATPKPAPAVAGTTASFADTASAKPRKPKAK